MNVFQNVITATMSAFHNLGSHLFLAKFSNIDLAGPKNLSNKEYVDANNVEMWRWELPLDNVQTRKLTLLRGTPTSKMLSLGTLAYTNPAVS